MKLNNLHVICEVITYILFVCMNISNQNFLHYNMEFCSIRTLEIQMKIVDTNYRCLVILLLVIAIMEMTIFGALLEERNLIVNKRLRNSHASCVPSYLRKEEKRDQT